MPAFSLIKVHVGWSPPVSMLAYVTGWGRFPAHNPERRGIRIEENVQKAL